MTINKEIAEKMDSVLLYLLANPAARVKSKQVQEILKVGFDEAKNIYLSILKYHQQVEPIVSILNADNIAARPDITESFIKKGGFKQVYEVLSQMSEKSNKKQVEKSARTLSDWQQKTYWITFALALSGFILGLISLLISMGLIKT